jgi:hypothetical protein
MPWTESREGEQIEGGESVAKRNIGVSYKAEVGGLSNRVSRDELKAAKASEVVKVCRVWGGGSIIDILAG